MREITLTTIKTFLRVSDEKKGIEIIRRGQHPSHKANPGLQAYVVRLVGEHCSMPSDLYGLTINGVVSKGVVNVPNGGI